MQNESTMKNKFTTFIKNSSLFLFIREVILHPRSMGAACPSSSHLAKKIAEQVKLTKNTTVVELGGGTGVVTDALIKHGIAENQLLVIERSAALADHLVKRFPSVAIINADAQDMQHYLQNRPVDCVVSGLPLRSLPKNVVAQILAEAENVLDPAGTFIQFTYSWRSNDTLSFKSLKRIYSKYVWFNLPPARIDVYGDNKQ